MYILTANIRINSKRTWTTFDKIVSCEIERNAENLTTTCKIVLPKKVKWQGEDCNPFKRGDAIEIRLGYNGENTLAFCGYITKVGTKTPIVIECEDEMWKLKATPATKKAYKSATIKQILDDQKLTCDISVMGKQSLGAYRVDCDNVAELLSAWKEQGIRSFFKHDQNGDTTLYCGVIFDKNTERVQTFDNHKNIISDNLTFQKADEIKIKVNAISLDANNKKTKVEVGDKDGETRTLHAYCKTEKELKEWAEQEFVRLKRDGLTGSFETFGAFLVDTLDVIGVVLDGSKMGTYQVKKNIITYGTSGFRQNIEVGDRMDATNETKLLV